jgi:putative flavoprotein involved in K+ transport
MRADESAKKWLIEFDAALQKQDIDKAVDMFHAESYWRDLVSFTWNLKTAEGQAQIRDMLQATLEKTRPSHWVLEGNATETDGITEAWFTFETLVSRGKGLLRLRDGKAWTLLTTMVELKGFEEAKGESRPKGVEHG